MLTLFLDTTNGITVGLLNEDFQWCHYNYNDSKKSSSIVHKLIKDGLDAIDKSQEDIKNCIQMSGPGSYTGMRVSEGISQVLEWQGVTVYGLYHFQVPRILGETSGVWIAKAFKGEVFVYAWEQDEVNNYMVKESELVNHLSNFTLSNKKIFSSLKFDLNNNLKNDELNDVSIIETKALIEARPQEIFNHVIKAKISEPLYYFRSIEEEFSKAKK